MELNKELRLQQAHLSFILPLGYHEKLQASFHTALLNAGFQYIEVETDREATTVKHNGNELKQYFLPYIEETLFPQSPKERGFHRYKKTIDRSFQYSACDAKLPVVITSIDIMLAPFGIAFITLHCRMQKDSSFSNVVDFLHRFRAVEPILEEEQGMTLYCSETGDSLSTHELLFNELCPFLHDYIVNYEQRQRYVGSLPFFEDERMYVTAYLFCEEGAEIETTDLFRLGTLDGKGYDGRPFISASNQTYIEQYVNKAVHNRWAPHTYSIVTNHAFISITNQRPSDMARELSQHRSTHYYNLLLHYFYKMMLLRFAYEYSRIEWKKDDEYVKSLIKLITLFSSWYFFQEVSTRSEGRELSRMFRSAFTIDSLYQEVNNTLHELYQNQESVASDRMNQLLFFLTVFTVISGIYGMNLVIEDWETPFDFRKVKSYTFFEWVSLITALGGIGLSIYLVFLTFGKLLIRKLRQLFSNTID